MTDERVVAKIIDDVGLFDGGGIAAIELAKEAPAKQALRAQTDEAIERGVFGVPTVEVDGELFWGVDALEHVEPFLRGEDPVKPELLAKWDHIEASAQRRR